MKVSVRVSKYASPIEDCYISRYDAILFSTNFGDDLINRGTSNRYVTQKVYEGKEFNKKEFVEQLKQNIADGFTKAEKLPKLDSSDEYIEISI